MKAEITFEILHFAKPNEGKRNNADITFDGGIGVKGYVISKSKLEILLGNVYRGLSAYEIAVKNGFEGTEEEWLESLKADIVNELGDSENAVMSQKAVTDAITNTINLTDLDFDLSMIGKIISGGNSCKFVVMSNSRNVGILHCFSDDLQHMLTQVFTTHYIAPFSGGSFTHSDDKIYQYFRSYHLSGGTSTIPTGTWGEWKLVFSSDNQKDVEEDITQQIMAEITAYTTVVGKAPSKNDEISTQYGIKGKIFDVTDIKSFTLHSQSGGTCRLWAKIKNGIITEMASYSASVVDITIENDGTFDKLVINLYHGTAVILKTVLFTDYIDSQIDNLKDEVSSLKTEIDTLQNSKTLKILMFGNSFTHDSAGYVPFILKSMYPNLNLELGIAFYSGCSLAQHLASLSGQNVTLDEQNITPQTYWYSLSINGGKWTTNYSKDGTDIIKDKDWDIITFQQNGRNAFSNWNTYFKPFIYKIQKLIYEKVNKPVKLGWVLTHGSYAGTDLVTLKQNWQGTADNSQKVIQNSLADFIMPYGTAVQNLRNVYDSSWGGQADLLGDDDVHMQEGLPCLTAAYCHAIKILELVGLPLSIIGNKLEPTKEWVEEYALGPNYYNDDVMSVDDSNRFIAQACAIQAIKNPYTITDISEIINNL